MKIYVPKKIKKMKFWEWCGIKYLVMIMKIIERKKYLDELLSLKNKPDIKIITGVRRAGKSMLLSEYIKTLKRIEEDANVILVDFNRIVFDEIKEYKNLTNT